jgi:apolipoprotein N-acyltransferase
MKNNLIIFINWLLSDPFFCSMLSGALFTLAFAPFNVWPIAFIAIPLFLFSLQNSFKITQIFWSGWAFGFGHYITSIYWIANSLTFQLEKFGWLIPLSILGIPMILAIYTGILAFLTCVFRTNKIVRVFAFASLWVVFEWIRSNLLLPFPWNLAGYILGANDYTLQTANIFGLYGASFIVMLLSTAFYMRSRIILIPYLFIIALLVTYGINRHNQQNQTFVEYANIKLIQPNLSEPHFGDLDIQKDHIIKLVEATILSSQEDVTHIIWPEAAYPALIREHDKALDTLATLAPPEGMLIFGTDRLVKDSTSTDLSHQYEIYNSIIVLGHNKKVLATYDKELLVPFGEYVPLRKYFTVMDKIAQGMMDFSPGVSNSRVVIDTPTLPPFIPLICYEITLPNLKTDKQAEWILNITNDLWFGNTIGPYQHLAMARFRAVELGLPVIRVANTGISAVFTAYGEELQRLNYGESGSIITKLPAPIFNSFNSWLREVFSSLPFYTLILMVIIEIYHRMTKRLTRKH